MTELILKVQGYNNAESVGSAFSTNVFLSGGRGGWYRLWVPHWPGTHYAGLIHARKAVPGVRIHCPSARSERQP